MFTSDKISDTEVQYTNGDISFILEYKRITDKTVECELKRINNLYSGDYELEFTYNGITVLIEKYKFDNDCLFGEFVISDFEYVETFKLKTIQDYEHNKKFIEVWIDEKINEEK